MLDLESLLRTRYSGLTEAEINLSRAAASGTEATCGPTLAINERTNNPNSWNQHRQIRADLIRWLCVDRRAKECVDPRGIRVLAARISGVLDLSHVIVPFPLTFAWCSLHGELNLRGADVPEINLQGTWVQAIAADRATVRSSILLREGFHASGPVRLPAARISGNVECDGSTFENPFRPGEPESGVALIADGAIVEGSVFLREGFRALGEVRLTGAKIGGCLDCTNASFDNNPYVALNAGSMVVGSSVFLRGKFSSQGEVKLEGSQIDVDLDCGAGTFSNPRRSKSPSTGIALSLERIVAKGCVFLRNGFTADGEVRLLGARITGNVDCDGGTFSGTSSEGTDGENHSLSVHTAIVRGNIYLRNGFHATGEVAFSSAQIAGNLECTGGAFQGDLNLQAASITGVFFWRNIVSAECARLDLMSASIGVLADDRESWPEPGKLLLDGLVYGRIHKAAMGASDRLEWLDLQDSFAPQPYRQLAKTLRNEGDDSGARQVLVEMERRRRKKEDNTIYARSWSWTLLRTIKYGYSPGIALQWLAGLILAGAIFFGAGYYAGDVVPIEKDAYRLFRDCRQLPPEYQRFHALIYSAENSFPLVKLGQVDRWQPTPDPHNSWGRASCPARCLTSLLGYALLWFRWIQILLGWVLATLFVAGVTGVVRKE